MRAIREQLAYLERFAAQLASGAQRLDGTLRRRARLYTQAARQTFEGVRERVNVARGMSAHRSVRHATDSCEECLALDAQGWVPIDEPLPLPGQRICGPNCRCSIEYR